MPSRSVRYRVADGPGSALHEDADGGAEREHGSTDGGRGDGSLRRRARRARDHRVGSAGAGSACSAIRVRRSRSWSVMVGSDQLAEVGGEGAQPARAWRWMDFTVPTPIPSSRAVSVSVRSS